MFRSNSKPRWLIKSNITLMWSRPKFHCVSVSVVSGLFKSGKPYFFFTKSVNHTYDSFAESKKLTRLQILTYKAY